MVSMGAALSVRSITVALGSSTILHDVSLEVGPGQAVAVVGPSGGGKSTLLRAVVGLAPLRSGAVLLDGVDQAAVPVHRRGMGLVAQDGALFPHRDVSGNVGFGLRLMGWDRARAAGRVAEVLELVGLAGLQHRAVQQLSGGERQRVALARALAPSPRLLLLDEPLGALDRDLRGRLAAELGSLVRHLGISVLLVTHDQEEAGALADELIVLRSGAIVQHGPPPVVHGAPVDGWVAGFLGHRNVVRVGSLPQPLREVLDLPPGGDDLEGLIAEDRLKVHPAGGGTASAPGHVPGTVVAVHRRPARPGVLIDVGGSVLWAPVPGWAVQVGGAVDLEVAPGTIPVFDDHLPVVARRAEDDEP